jgi:peptide methionine sulfoxide reductase MsrB
MPKVERIQINLWKEKDKHTGKVDMVDSNGKSTRFCLDSLTLLRNFVKKKAKEEKNEQRTS